MGVDVKRKSRYTDHGRLCRRCGRTLTLGERIAMIKVCDSCKDQTARDKRIGEPKFDD